MYLCLEALLCGLGAAVRWHLSKAIAAVKLAPRRTKARASATAA